MWSDAALEGVLRMRHSVCSFLAVAICMSACRPALLRESVLTCRASALCCVGVTALARLLEVACSRPRSLTIMVVLFSLCVAVQQSEQ